MLNSKTGSASRGTQRATLQHIVLALHGLSSMGTKTCYSGVVWCSVVAAAMLQQSMIKARLQKLSTCM